MSTGCNRTERDSSTTHHREAGFYVKQLVSHEKSRKQSIVNSNDLHNFDYDDIDLSEAIAILANEFSCNTHINSSPSGQLNGAGNYASHSQNAASNLHRFSGQATATPSTARETYKNAAADARGSSNHKKYDIPARRFSAKLSEDDLLRANTTDEIDEHDYHRSRVLGRASTSPNLLVVASPAFIAKPDRCPPLNGTATSFSKSLSSPSACSPSPAWRTDTARTSKASTASSSSRRSDSGASTTSSHSLRSQYSSITSKASRQSSLTSLVAGDDGASADEGVKCATGKGVIPWQSYMAAGGVLDVPVDGKGRAYPYLMQPHYPNTYATIGCCGTAQEKQELGLYPLTSHTVYVKFNGIANGPIKHVCREAGLRTTKGSNWLVCWGAVLKPTTLSALTEFQRTNHFPGTWEVGRKDKLYKNVGRMQRLRPGHFNFVPQFFLLPRDQQEFKNHLERNPGGLYIQKPVASSRGRGVKMVVNAADAAKSSKDCIIQHYISNPLIVNGFKFDMRVYVAVTCLDPLRVYVYKDGLARFATEKYSTDKKQLKKRRMHLTNYSVNKSKQKDGTTHEAVEVPDGEGHKWSLTALQKYLEEHEHVPWKYIWQQVRDIAAQVMISVDHAMNIQQKMNVAHRNNCFEVFGFDILLDSNYRAWLMEVNTCPSLGSDSPVDWRVKTEMLSDLLTMVGPVPYDRQEYDDHIQSNKAARLTGLRPVGQDDSVMKGKTIRDAQDFDFTGVPLENLPEVVREAEAEWRRAGNFDRILPCHKQPSKYSSLFETQRYNNVLLSNYYGYKKKLLSKSHKAL